MRMITDNIGIILLLLVLILIVISMIVDKIKSKREPTHNSSKSNISKPLVEGRTKGNMKRRSSRTRTTGRMALPPAPAKRTIPPSTTTRIRI